MTSTLQQEASRKFGMGARQTMSAAQRLYEAGLITYMRTDGIDMAPEAVMATRDAIKDRYGAEYVPDSPRMYKNKAKNAQEAHECIRPTDMTRDAGSVKLSEPDQRKLYDLIWKRTIACQMSAARMERTTVDITSADGQVGLRATGQVVLFDGFLRVYEEGRDDVGSGDEDDKRLPQIMQGEKAEKRSVTPEQHFTQPPPRYTEATLVKRMEELGIGRPSTYASIVTTIQERDYVRKDKNRLIPEDKGRIVTIFLLNFFRKYVGYEFTANLEEELDVISAGDADYKTVLANFWRDFSAAIAETSDLRISEVLDKLDEALAPQLYPPREDGSDPRSCPLCSVGSLHLKTSRTGGFVGCSRYPDCRYTRPIGGEEQTGDRVLGEDNGDEIFLRSGRFGPYVQRGEVTEDVKKPPRASLPKGWSADDMDLSKALTLLSLPREVGPHPDDGEMIEAGIGRYGPFVKHGRLYANLKEVDEVFTIGMNRAVEELAKKAASRGKGRGAAAKPLKELGEHPESGGAVNVMDGRYGPYVKWEKVNATLPKDVDPTAVTMDMAVALIAEKEAKGGKGRKKAPTKKKAAAGK
jgi:DNA topoisomerase-1